jgi:hypothetical protein
VKFAALNAANCAVSGPAGSVILSVILLFPAAAAGVTTTPLTGDCGTRVIVNRADGFGVTAKVPVAGTFKADAGITIFIAPVNNCVAAPPIVMFRDSAASATFAVRTAVKPVGIFVIQLLTSSPSSISLN